MKKLTLIFVLFFFMKCFQDNSEEFYNCLNPDKIVNNSFECTYIKIPESEGYKCCSMKVVFDDNITYNCFTLESKYVKDQKTLDAYTSSISLASLFGTSGGEIEIECENNSKNISSTHIYEKISDEFTNCYNNHINGVDNESECLVYDIPEKEMSKCCYLETSQKDIKGNIIKDKRCYIIQNEYFTKEKDLNIYLLDKTNKKSLDQIQDINITINCKNQDIFHFISKSVKSINPTTIVNSDIATDIMPNDNNPYRDIKKSESNTKIIVIVVIVCVAVLIGISILIYYCIKKRQKVLESNYNESEVNKSNKTMN